MRTRRRLHYGNQVSNARISSCILRSHCDEFDETSEENKLVYTEIYQLYTSAVEDFIEAELEKRVPDFRMKDFVKGKPIHRWPI